MGIRSDDQPRDFWTDIRTPRIGVRQEEPLQFGPAVRTFVVERFALALEIGRQRNQGEVNPAIIGRILALCQQTVLFHSWTRVGHVRELLIGIAFSTSVGLLGYF